MRSLSSSGLKVIARTSAFAFKGKNEDIRKIAQALGVTNVLEGSVRRAGRRLRITAQLIDAADGSHLWSQRYDRQLTDVFALQDEIAAAIVGTLRVKLNWPVCDGPHARAESARLRSLSEGQASSSDSPVFHNVGRAGRAGRGYFRQAISLYPQWATPHSALAQQYFFMGPSVSRPRPK